MAQVCMSHGADEESARNHMVMRRRINTLLLIEVYFMYDRCIICIKNSNLALKVLRPLPTDMIVSIIFNKFIIKREIVGDVQPISRLYSRR